MPASVLVATKIPAYAASVRIFRISIFGEPRTVIAPLSAMTPMTAMAAMTAVPPVSEQVHPDEGDADQQPEPVCNEPLHDVILKYVNVDRTLVLLSSDETLPASVPFANRAA
jgi:hypothetical protein